MIFYNDETVIPTPKLRIITKISKWEKYDCVENNNIKYIRGYSNEKKDSELFAFNEINTPAVLYKLMELYFKMPRELFSFDQIYVNNTLCDNDIKQILSFCKNYGLPFWNYEPVANTFINAPSQSMLGKTVKQFDIARETILRDIIPFSQYNFFPASSFIIGLMNLHADFLRIVYYHSWEDDINIAPLLSKRDKEIISKIKNRQIDKQGVSLFTPQQNPFVTYWDDNNLGLRLNCENLMHLSAYHLCILMQSGFIGSGYIKTCPKCNQMFIAQNSRQKFCNNPCTRQAYQSMKNRNKNKPKKEGSD